MKVANVTNVTKFLQNFTKIIIIVFYTIIQKIIGLMFGKINNLTWFFNDWIINKTDKNSSLHFVNIWDFESNSKNSGVFNRYALVYNSIVR